MLFGHLFYIEGIFHATHSAFLKETSEFPFPTSHAAGTQPCSKLEPSRAPPQCDFSEESKVRLWLSAASILWWVWPQWQQLSGAAPEEVLGSRLSKAGVNWAVCMWGVMSGRTSWGSLGELAVLCCCGASSSSLPDVLWLNLPPVHPFPALSSESGSVVSN